MAKHANLMSVYCQSITHEALLDVFDGLPCLFGSVSDPSACACKIGGYLKLKDIGMCKCAIISDSTVMRTLT